MTKKIDDKSPNKAKGDDKPSLFGRLGNKLSTKKSAPKSVRITNDTIEEHRADILAKGRKLKYPMQYSKKRLIIISISVVVIAMIALGLWLNIALYKQQQTGDFYYSVTNILPLNVASVDGEPVRYDDYLRRLRADIHYYINREHRTFNSEEGENELNYHKRISLEVAEKAAYVRYLAKENKIELDKSEVDEKIKQMIESVGATEESYISTLETYYGWTMNDFRKTYEDQLLEQLVSYELDTEAKSKIEDIADKVKEGEDFAALAKQLSDDEATKQNGGRQTAKIDSVNQDPTGIALAVSKLKEGAVTDIGRVRIDNRDYYYIAKLNKKTDEDIDYSIITVRLDKLNNDFAQLQKDGKIKEYIDVPTAEEFGE